MALLIWMFLACTCVTATDAQATLQAYPSVLLSNNENVTLEWSALQAPSIRDFIAIYYPPDSSSYIGWLPCRNSPGWESGRGLLQLPLVNVRSQYQFKLFHYGMDEEKEKQATAGMSERNATVAAVSNLVSFAWVEEPTQGRLALTHRNDQMRLMWTTNSSSSRQVVQFGLRADKLDRNATAVSYTYGVTDMCNAPATAEEYYRAPGVFHDAVLTNLEFATTYYYRYGSAATGFSPVRSFVSAPTISPSSEVDVICYGDLGVLPPFLTAQEVQVPAAQTSVHVLNQVSGLHEQAKPSLVFHVGDISYARGYAYLWEWFMSEIEPIATQAPYMVAIGNHEYDYTDQPWRPWWSDYGDDSGGECGIPYEYRFHMPESNLSATLQSAPFKSSHRSVAHQTFQASGASPRNLWYSFDYGPVHFTIMSTEHDFLPNSTQWNWLKGDLARVDRSITPWVIFNAHRPMYTSSEVGGGIAMVEELRRSIEPLLLEYDVDVVLVGHVHKYERTCGVREGVCADSDNEAPVHVVIGNAGNDYQVPWRESIAQHLDNHRLQPDWSVFRTSNYGFSRFHANATHFHFQFLGNSRGLVHDEFMLNK